MHRELSDVRRQQRGCEGGVCERKSWNMEKGKYGKSAYRLSYARRDHEGV